MRTAPPQPSGDQSTQRMIRVTRKAAEPTAATPRRTLQTPPISESGTTTRSPRLQVELIQGATFYDRILQCITLPDLCAVAFDIDLANSGISGRSSGRHYSLGDELRRRNRVEAGLTYRTVYQETDRRSGVYHRIADLLSNLLLQVLLQFGAQHPVQRDLSKGRQNQHAVAINDEGTAQLWLTFHDKLNLIAGSEIAVAQSVADQRDFVAGTSSHLVAGGPALGRLLVTNEQFFEFLTTHLQLATVPIAPGLSHQD